MNNILNWFNFLNETLLKTYDKDIVVKYLHSLNINKTYISIKNNKIRLYLTHKENKYVPEMLSKLENFFGWFLSGVEVSYMRHMMSPSDFKKELNDLDTLIPEPKYRDDNYSYVLIFESKYDIEIMNKDKPDILWHITDKKYINNIKHKGLIPKSKSKITYHPNRIYFLKDIKFANELLNNYYFKVDNPVILKIDISKIKHNIKIYQDCNYSNGVYITNNISPKYIDFMIII